MIGKCAELLTIWRCREEELEDVYYRAKMQYGIQSKLKFIFKFAVLLLVAAVMKQLKDFALFVFFLFLLRSYAGGHHGRTRVGRLYGMVVAEMAALWGMRLEVPLTVQVAAFLAAGMVLVWCAPCDSHKNPIIEPEVKRLKKSGTLLCVASYFILTLFWQGAHNVFLMSVAVETVSVLIEKIREKKRPKMPVSQP